MYAEKDSIGKTIIQDLDDFDVEILINCITESLKLIMNENHYSIKRKKIILKTLEDVNNGKRNY
jgi:hypothetical protein